MEWSESWLAGNLTWSWLLSPSTQSGRNSLTSPNHSSTKVWPYWSKRLVIVHIYCPVCMGTEDLSQINPRETWFSWLNKNSCLIKRQWWNSNDFHWIINNMYFMSFHILKIITILLKLGCLYALQEGGPPPPPHENDASNLSLPCLWLTLNECSFYPVMFQFQWKLVRIIVFHWYQYSISYKVCFWRTSGPK